MSFRALSVPRLRRLAGLMVAGSEGRPARFLCELLLPKGVLECFDAGVPLVGVDLEAGDFGFFWLCSRANLRSAEGGALAALLGTALFLDIIAAGVLPSASPPASGPGQERRATSSRAPAVEGEALIAEPAGLHAARSSDFVTTSPSFSTGFSPLALVGERRKLVANRCCAPSIVRFANLSCGVSSRPPGLPSLDDFPLLEGRKIGATARLLLLVKELVRGAERPPIIRDFGNGKLAAFAGVDTACCIF